MKTDIRRKTGLIIHRGGEFLVGSLLYSSDLRWSVSPWDAWITRRPESAEKVAEKVGGEIWLFNPIVGKRRKYRRDERKETEK